MQAEGTVAEQECRARKIVFLRQPDADRPALTPAGMPAACLGQPINLNLNIKYAYKQKAGGGNRTRIISLEG